MACKQCYLRYHNYESLADVPLVAPNQGWTAFDTGGRASVVCSICNGTGFIVPPSVSVTGGILGKAEVSYPQCKHCNGTGQCNKNDKVTWR